MFSPPIGGQMGVGFDFFNWSYIFPTSRFSESKGFGSLSLKKKLLSVKVEFIMINYPINFKWPLRPRKIRSDFGKAIFMVSGDQKKSLLPFFYPHFLQETIGGKYHTCSHLYQKKFPRHISIQKLVIF